jgi:hypothetical protein
MLYLRDRERDSLRSGVMRRFRGYRYGTFGGGVAVPRTLRGTRRFDETTIRNAAQLEKMFIH